MSLRILFIFFILSSFQSYSQVGIDSIYIQEDSNVVTNKADNRLIGFHFHPTTQTFDVVWFKNISGSSLLTDSVKIDTSYTNIYDIKYNELTKKVAIMAERGITPLLTSADANGSIDSVKKFCYFSFDNSGFVGYVNNSGQLIYQHYDGTKINVSDIDPDPKKIIAIDSSTSKKISVVISTNGYRLFDLSKKIFISDFYDTIYYFKPDVFYAKKQNQYSILKILSTGNLDAGSIYDSVHVIDGHKPCLDIYLNDSTHLLFVDQLHIDTIKNFNRQRGDFLMGYKYEDSVLVRIKNYGGYKAVYFVAGLNNNTWNPDTVYIFPTADTITIYPFFKNYYLSKRGAEGIYLTNLHGEKERLSADDRREYFKIDNPYNPNNEYFFYVSNNTADKTSTLFITITQNKNSVRSLDVSKASNKSIGYVSFGDNMLALKDNSFSSNGHLIGGWKLIDGYKACYKDAVQILDGSPLPDRVYPYAWTAKMRPFPSRLITNMQPVSENGPGRMFAIIEDDNLKIISVKYSTVDEATKTEKSNHSRNQQSKKKTK